jgi:cytidylate kinase
VSQEHGSLGSAVAELIANRLGFSFCDPETMQLMALQPEAQEALAESLDERERSALKDCVMQATQGIESTAMEEVRQLARVVGTFALHGSAVLLGRGAQFIVAPKASLRVRVVCPYEIRVRRIAELHSLSRRDVEREMRKVARDRQDFIRRRYQRDIGAPVHYDLVVNTGAMDTDPAAGAVVSVYRCKFPVPNRSMHDSRVGTGSIPVLAP